MENLRNRRLRSERQSRKTSYESRSDESDKNCDFQATRRRGIRRVRNENRSTSETGGSFRNKHKHENGSQSRNRSSSTSSTSSGLRRGRKESRRRNDKDRKRSCSPERNQGKGKRRTNSNDESYNSYRREKVRSNIVRKKTDNRRGRNRSSDQSRTRTRNCSDKRSSSREMTHSSDRSFSRTRNHRNKKSNSRDWTHSSERNLSRTRNRRDKKSNSREMTHSSERNLSRTRNRRDKRRNSHDRKHSSDRSLSITRNYRHERNCTRERRHSLDHSLSKTRHHRKRQNHSHDRKRNNRNSLSREGKRKTDDMRRYRSPDFHMDRRSYFRERICSSSSSGHRQKRRSSSRERNRSSSIIGRDKKYSQYSPDRFYTLRPKKNGNQREKYMSSDTPTPLDNITLLSNLFKELALPQADPQTVRLKTTSKSSPIQFQWQFQDEHGIWIPYGKSNSSGDSSATTTSSDDIETHYMANSTHPNLQVQSNQNHYLLNFQNMTQTNQKTSVQRLIRRISNQSPNIAPVNLSSSFIVGGVSNVNILHEWQFRDEHGSWITYGKPNSAGNGPHATTTCSDDIEKHYAKNQANPAPLPIKSKSNAQYVLDFVGMIQTNQTTSVQRPIRRIPKHSANTNHSHSINLVGMSNTTVPHDWQFQDEHGIWITYGQPNSAGNASHATTTCSDDIEKHYANNPANPAPLNIKGKTDAQYVLDFKKMMQTNQQTSVERKIRRIPRNSTWNIASPKGCSFVWSFKDDHGSWIKYGGTSSSGGGTSDDIETKFSQNPAASFEIFSGQHKYLLDFKALTQTNIDTKTVRDIRRQIVTASDLPSHWKPMKTSDKGLLVVPLNKTDSEYTKQETFVKKTLPAKHTITKLCRIQNENLWNDFVYRKNSLKARYPNVQFKEDHLFHGTDSKHLKAICEESLDFRLNGTNGTLYGRGTYFARSADYSVTYSSGSPKVMFIVKVLVGRYTVGSTTDRRPPKDKSGDIYDTTVDSASSPTIFVKYDNSEYYPEYYFEFT